MTTGHPSPVVGLPGGQVRLTRVRRSLNATVPVPIRGVRASWAIKKREALPERPTDRGPMGGANVTKRADGIVTGRSGLDLVDQGAGADEGA